MKKSVKRIFVSIMTALLLLQSVPCNNRMVLAEELYAYKDSPIEISEDKAEPITVDGDGTVTIKEGVTITNVTISEQGMIRKCRQYTRLV